MKREDLFEELEPPPGGLAKLRERMNARPSARIRARVQRFVPATAALAIAAIVFLFFWSRRPPDLVAAAREHGATEQVALGLAPSLGRSAAVADTARGTTALSEVSTSNPNVAFYWVMSTPQN
jgi:hypothetical protein